MSIYEEVKAEFGEGPQYPTRAPFTGYYGYSGGKSIGFFSDVESAKKAGAVVTEKTFDTDGFNTARDAHLTHGAAIVAEWEKRVRAEYLDISDEIFTLAYRMASERNTADHGEVEVHIGLYVDFANLVLGTTK